MIASYECLVRRLTSIRSAQGARLQVNNPASRDKGCPRTSNTPPTCTPSRVHSSCTRQHHPGRHPNCQATARVANLSLKDTPFHLSIIYGVAFHMRGSGVHAVSSCEVYSPGARISALACDRRFRQRENLDFTDKGARQPPESGFHSPSAGSVGPP